MVDTTWERVPDIKSNAGFIFFQSYISLHVLCALLSLLSTTAILGFYISFVFAWTEV